MLVKVVGQIVLDSPPQTPAEIEMTHRLLAKVILYKCFCEAVLELLRMGAQAAEDLTLKSFPHLELFPHLEDYGGEGLRVKVKLNMSSDSIEEVKQVIDRWRKKGIIIWISRR